MPELATTDHTDATILTQPTFTQLYYKLTTSYDDYLDELAFADNDEIEQFTPEYARLGGPLYNTLAISPAGLEHALADSLPGHWYELRDHMRGIALVTSYTNASQQRIATSRLTHPLSTLSNHARVPSLDIEEPINELVQNYESHVQHSDKPVYALFAVAEHEAPYLTSILGSQRRKDVA